MTANPLEIWKNLTAGVVVIEYRRSANPILPNGMIYARILVLETAWLLIETYEVPTRLAALSAQTIIGITQVLPDRLPPPTPLPAMK